MIVVYCSNPFIQLILVLSLSFSTRFVAYTHTHSHSTALCFTPDLIGWFNL